MTRSMAAFARLRRPELECVPLARRAACIVLLSCLAVSKPSAQPSVYESEPNDTPAEANPITAPSTALGSMVRQDQDGFVWSVSDVDAQKRWTFELHGIPGKLTIAEVLRVRYAENGVDVTGYDQLMKMGSRDGVTPAVAEDLIFEPGEYLIGLAHGGGHPEQGGAFRPPAAALSFGEDGEPERAPEAAPASDAATDAAPGAYRFAIREGARLTVRENPGARTDREQAQSMRLGREFATFEPRETSWYAFDFSDADREQRWDLSAQVPVGRSLSAALVDSAGDVLASASTEGRGSIKFSDIVPAPGTYYVRLETEGPGAIHTIASESVGVRQDGEEAEPNDTWALANRVDLAEPVTGRINRDNDADYFGFTVDEAAADQRLSIRLEAESERNIRLCLHADDGARLQCRRTVPPVELSDVVLTPGRWGLGIGRAEAGLEYRLALTPLGPIEPGTEAEPNDTIELASGVPANQRITGRFTGGDDDYFRFTIADEPQLWRFQVIGENIDEVAYHDAAGHQTQSVRPAAGQRRVRLDNVYLLPGQHHLRVSGKDGGSYTVLARALGPPDADAEREPNDDTARMQRLAMGQTRTGLLSEQDDTDLYRFFLANWDHISVTVEPPADGAIRATLHWYGQTLVSSRNAAPGKPVDFTGLFPPGDYHVSLNPATTSEVDYRLGLQRLERFACPADCEPNGVTSLNVAAPLPATLQVEGTTTDWDEWDGYELPQLREPGEVTIRTERASTQVRIQRSWGDGNLLEPDAAEGAHRATLPSDAPYRLYVRDRQGPYRVDVDFADGPAALPVPGPLGADLDLVLDTDEVSAFRRHGQRIAGSLRLTNTGTDALRAELETATSDHRWQADLEHREIEVPAGGTAAVPVRISVPADAWADRPVRISVRAQAADGAHAETWQAIAVRRDIPAVNPTWGWAVPNALRGGFNAAWSGFGGDWAPAPTSALGNNFDDVRDGLTLPGNGMLVRGGWDRDAPPALTIRLPGEAPVPVAGMALDLFGSRSVFNDIRRATLLLSENGTDYVEALHVETLPVKTEQYFALEQPVMARFARLRIDATYDANHGRGASLGEWKVITAPGHDLSDGGGFDLADPALGGHVVWSEPSISPQWDNAILAEGGNQPLVRLRPGQDLEWVLAFHHNRAAQIERLEWVEPPSLPDERRFEHVTVAVSTHSPTGPWQHLAEWDVGGEPTLELETPAWARFVKYTAHGAPSRAVRAVPDVIRVWERPTDADYGSILTEWGPGVSEASYELHNGLDGEPAVTATDNGTRAEAAPLELGATVSGQVALGEREHWYRLAIPDDRNTLNVTLTGDPTVRSVLELEAADGEPVRLVPRNNEHTPDRHTFEAVVQPGAQYFVRVTEPPRNVVFSWDTSGSVNAYLPTIYNALAAFAGQVQSEREAVNLLPFGRGLLLRDWYGEAYVLQTILNDYRRRESSSNAEGTLETGARALGALPGTKAIVLITDATTGAQPSMWEQMKSTRPRVFGIGVGGSFRADQEQDHFQDWASVNGGDYRQMRYDGEMEVAFDRAATLLRRPADYTLRVDAEFREAPGPGSLAVVAADDGGAAGAAAVELILDASGSMLQRMEGRRRIEIARDVLVETIEEHVPAGTPVALRVFGHQTPNACRTDLAIPLGPLDPAAAAAVIGDIEAMNLARTPIADSLTAVQRDLEGASGRSVVVLVTDGEETCDGDPAAAIAALQDAGVAVNVNIVGFAIDDPELEARFESWAAQGGGRYLSAGDQSGLSAALHDALQVPYTVYDSDGNRLADGLVGGEPVPLEQGTYRVIVDTARPTRFDRVEVPGETAVTLEVP